MKITLKLTEANVKILIISNLYPSSPDIDDQSGVMLLHQYTKCWSVENEVVVINPHSYNILTWRKLAKRGLLPQFELDNISIYNEPILRLPGDYLQVKKFEKIVDQLGKFDFIIGCLPVGLEIAHHVGKKLNIPYFSYLHNTDYHRSGLSNGSISRKYKNFLSKAIGLMFVSPRLQSSFEEAISKQGILLPGAISKEWFKNQTNKSPQSSSLKLVTSARLVKQKNISSILIALKDLDETNFNFVITGDGDQRSYLEKFVESDSTLSDKVEFTGMIDHAHLMQLFDENDFMILLSTNESFGLVYVEAMARGCIPIGTIGEGIDGVIEQGVNGFLCYPDSESIRQMLMEILEIPKSKLFEMSKAAKQTAKNFVYDNLAESFIGFAKTKLADV